MLRYSISYTVWWGDGKDEVMHAEDRPYIGSHWHLNCHQISITHAGKKFKKNRRLFKNQPSKFTSVGRPLSKPHWWRVYARIWLGNLFEFTPDENSNDDLEDQMSEGDQLFCTSVLPLSEEIWASQTTSQRLAEAHQKTVGTETEIPKHLRDFGDVLLKESFDALSNRKIWDHAIELKLGSKPANCKVYLLLLNEQTELDGFLHIQDTFICPTYLWLHLCSSLRRRMAPST